ncbi:MAG: 8-oxo-dGTP diphosphatase [Patescibacteria group bacterium]|nr:8-oxo-dGTP diphosphatase [Patescibacteria group bacterium]
MKTEQQRPKVGVGVIIIRDGKVLLGQRKNAHGEGSWSFAGGHLEFGEGIEKCARSEALEETGLEIADVRLGPYTNDIFEDEGKHYITLFVICTAVGEPRVMEPDKCVSWEWFKWEELSENLFLPVKNLVESGFKP